MINLIKKDAEQYIDEAIIAFVMLNLILALYFLVTWQVITLLIIIVEFVTVMFIVTRGIRVYGKSKIL